MEEQNNPEMYNPEEKKVKGSIGFGILGFLLPVIGLLLYLIWNKKKPEAAKGAGVGALIGAIFGVIMCIVFYFVIWPIVQRLIVEDTCSTFGPNYTALIENGNWVCVDGETKYKISADTGLPIEVNNTFTNETYDFYDFDEMEEYDNLVN